MSIEARILVVDCLLFEAWSLLPAPLYAWPALVCFQARTLHIFNEIVWHLARTRSKLTMEEEGPVFLAEEKGNTNGAVENASSKVTIAASIREVDGLVVLGMDQADVDFYEKFSPQMRARLNRKVRLFQYERASQSRREKRSTIIPVRIHLTDRLACLIVQRLISACFPY